MIRHCVMLALPDAYDRYELDRIMQGLRALSERLSGSSGFIAGDNIDLEGKSPDFPFGFTIDFSNVEALQEYAQDAEHIKLGGRLAKLCGGGDKIIVFDLEEPT